MAFKICIGDPKTKKTYQVEKEAVSLIGVKIGQKFDGGMIGLDGFTLQVTGGSDKEGFPMRKEVDGPLRKKLLLTGNPGFNPRFGGERKRKYIRGNQISDDIAQVNCKIVEGEGDIGLMLGIKKGEGDKKESSEAKPASSDTPASETDKEKPKPEEKPAEAPEKKPEAKPEEKKPEPEKK